MDQNLAARLRFGRILHATDLSPSGGLAFAHSLKLALAARGDFLIVHTAANRDQAGSEWEAFPGVRQTLTSWGLLPEGAPKSAVTETLGVNVLKLDIPDHGAAHGIQGLVERYGVDLVVMASQARDGVSRWLHPSIAESVARETRLPTLFLPHDGRGFVDPADGTTTLRNILVPIDRHPDPGSAISIALNLAALVGAGQARIHLLHVGDTWPMMPALEEGEPRFVRHHGTGPVVDTIIATAESVDADLIVMATHGHDGILDALRGSTTEQVLRRSGRALLAAPAD